MTIAERLNRLARAPTNAVDRLFGYDVFVAHRRADGAGYAARLVERLDREKLSSFIDRREYGPGDDLSAATVRHIRRATMLVVVGSPAILEAREPDWVLTEIDTYIASRPAHRRLLLPIDFGQTLCVASDRSPIVARLANTIRIEEPLEALDGPPSDTVVGAITQQFRKRRRDSVRLRVFQGIAATLGALALLAGTLAWLANNALGEARRNLAENYLTAARSRLDAGYGDEAAALAAESLRNNDTDEARRLIVEHPPVDLGQVLPSEEGVFAFDIDPAGQRLATVGYQGVMALRSLGTLQPSKRVRLGREDVWGVSFTPDGRRLWIRDDSGQVQVLGVDDLAHIVCTGVPRLDDRVDRFSFRPGRRSVLVRADEAIYSLANDRGCPSGPPRLLYRSPESIADYVIDEANDRLILTQNDGLVVVSLSEPPSEPPRFHPMPLAAGRTERPQPMRIALQPRTNVLAVFPLGGAELFFLDREMTVTEPLGVQPFAADRPLHLHAFGFDASGDRLVLAGDDGRAVVWSMAERRLERRVRIHELGVDLALLRSDSLLALGRDTAATDGFRSTVRVVRLDPPARRPIDLAGAGRLRSLESAPSGGTVGIGSRGGGVLSFGFGTGTAVPLAREDYPIEWVGASPGGGRVAYFGQGEVTILQAGRKVRRETFIEQSPTGLYSAAWLEDGTALAVGGGWTKPILIPVDPALPVSTGPRMLNGSVDDITPGPNGQVILREREQTWIWDTRRNAMRPVDLVPGEGPALIDLAPWGPDGVAALARGKLFLWRWIGSGEPGPVIELPIVADEIAVSANGKRLAAFKRSELSIYDLPGGKLRATLAFSGGDVQAAALSADGSTLIAATRDGPLIRWSLRALDLPAADLADSVQRLTGRVRPDFSLTLPRAPDPRGGGR